METGYVQTLLKDTQKRGRKEKTQKEELNPFSKRKPKVSGTTGG